MTINATATAAAAHRDWARCGRDSHRNGDGSVSWRSSVGGYWTADDINTDGTDVVPDFARAVHEVESWATSTVADVPSAAAVAIPATASETADIDLVDDDGEVVAILACDDRPASGSRQDAVEALAAVLDARARRQATDVLIHRISSQTRVWLHSSPEGLYFESLDGPQDDVLLAPWAAIEAVADIDLGIVESLRRLAELSEPVGDDDDDDDNAAVAATVAAAAALHRADAALEAARSSAWEARAHSNAAYHAAQPAIDSAASRVAAAEERLMAGRPDRQQVRWADLGDPRPGSHRVAARQIAIWAGVEFSRPLDADSQPLGGWRRSAYGI